MKQLLKNTISVVFIILAATNVYILVAGMSLSNDISKYDFKIKKLKSENTQLESEINRMESLQYASSLSAALKFTKKAQPVYFENLKYALNR